MKYKFYLHTNDFAVQINKKSYELLQHNLSLICDNYVRDFHIDDIEETVFSHYEVNGVLYVLSISSLKTNNIRR